MVVVFYSLFIVIDKIEAETGPTYMFASVDWVLFASHVDAHFPNCNGVATGHERAKTSSNFFAEAGGKKSRNAHLTAHKIIKPSAVTVVE